MVEGGATAGQASLHIITIKNNDNGKLPFLCGWHRANTFLPLSISIVKRKWHRGKGDEGGGAFYGRGRNRLDNSDRMWPTSLPNPDVSDSPLRTYLHPHHCLHAFCKHAGNVECNAAEPGWEADLRRLCPQRTHRTTREPRPLTRSQDGNARPPSALVPATLPSTYLLPPAFLSTRTNSSPSGTPFITGAWRSSRTLTAREGRLAAVAGIPQGGAGRGRVRIRRG